jgi:hypothetical protein
MPIVRFNNSTRFCARMLELEELQSTGRIEFPNGLDGKVRASHHMLKFVLKNGGAYMTMNYDKILCSDYKPEIKSWHREEFLDTVYERARVLFFMFRRVDEKGSLYFAREQADGKDVLVFYSPSEREKKIY